MTEIDAWSDEPLERNRYHQGMLLQADDLRCEQLYHRRTHATLVRAVHGAGTVCGLAVRPTDPPSRQIVVDAGLAVDGLGRQIVVPSEQTLAVDDPERSGGATRWVVAIRFSEVPVRPVPVPIDPDAQHTRVRESFELFLASIRILDAHRPGQLRARLPVRGEELHAWLVERTIAPCPPAVEADLPLAVVDLPLTGSITTGHIDNTVRPIVPTADLLIALIELLAGDRSPM